MQTPSFRLFAASSATLFVAAFAAFACSKSSGTTADTGDAGEDAGPWYAPTPPAWDQPVTRPDDSTAAAARAACTYTRGMMPAATLGPSTPMDDSIPIHHVIVLMQENRSFDTYLGHLNQFAGRTDIESADAGAFNPDKPAGGSATSAVRRSAAIRRVTASDGGGDDAGSEDAGVSDAGPSTGGGSVADASSGEDAGPPEDAGYHPWTHADHLCSADTDHSWYGAHVEWDNGLNDGFYYENSGRIDPVDDAGYPASLLDGARSLWFYDQTDIPFHYSLYSTFAISDHYFCGLLGPTWPNRDYLYAATSLGVTDNSFPDLTNFPFPVPGKEACIFDELEERAITWNTYTDGSPGPATFLGLSLLERYNSRNPHLAIADFLSQAQAGTLPQVSFVDAKLGADDGPGNDDEHPPSQIQIGEHFVWEIVNAVETSPLWKDTVLFVTYDENGGFYDHVPPPKACAPDNVAPILANAPDKTTKGGFDQEGFRVPFVVVSPYAKQGYVSHTVYDHASITKFIESKFKLPVLTGRDANADPFTDLFDWQNPPFLTPPVFQEPPINASEASYCNTTY